MVEQKTQDSADWKQLKNRQKRPPKRQRGANIFNGRAQWFAVDGCALPMVRLDVAPQGQAVPTSYSVLPEVAGRVRELQGAPGTLAPAAGGDRGKQALNLQWQQSLPGTFDLWFPMPEGARCFGLGERYCGLNLRGGVHTLCTTDETKHTEFADPLYKAIPFLILQHGKEHYGVFVDSPAPQRWNLDVHLNGEASIELYTRRGFQLYVMGPGFLPQVVEAYTQLTGRAALPPLWALGHQQCRWSYADQQTVLHVAHEFRSRSIPCDTIVLDIDYMDGYRVFTSSPDRFPDFDTLAATLRKDNFNVITIVDPGIKCDTSYPAYAEIVREKLYCQTPDGKPFVDEVWPGECVFPDFELERMRALWGSWHKFYTDRGIAGIWNDMNEPAFFNWKKPLDEPFDEMPSYGDQRFMQQAPDGPVGHLEVRNRYGMLMCRATWEGLTKLRPDERPFVLTRSAYAGSQRYAAVWLGDNNSWWEHLRLSMPMLLNVGLSGFPFAGVDVGGFSGDCDAELLTRWYELGIFYPFFRNHCRLGERAQEPWAFGERTERMIRGLIEWRYRLLPYIYGLFWEHLRTGAPLMRPLCWQYGDDPWAAEVDDQFMLGGDVLVAPVVARGKRARTIYFPPGRWHRLDGSSEPVAGGGALIVDMPLGCMPAWVREGAILPLADVMQSTAQFESTPITLKVFGDRAEGVFFEDDGKSLAWQRGGFNEWRLSYHGGKFQARRVKGGYSAPARRFHVEAEGRRSPVELAGP